MITRRKQLAVCYIVAAMAPAFSTMAQEAAPAAAPDAGKPEDVFEARVFQHDGAALPYRLLKPLGYDGQADRKYPLVLFLHGAGERGDENVRQLIHGGRNFVDPAMRRRHPAFVVAPQCPAEKKWVEVPWDGKNHTMPEDAGPTMNSVLALLDALPQEFKIDSTRLYGIGLSMGGFGVWDIVQRKPGLLAAAVPICGGGDPAFASRFKHTPVWAFHGGADPVVMPERSRQMIAALEAAGGRPIYTEYEGVEHNSWTPTFDNRLMWDWMFAQRKSE